MLFVTILCDWLAGPAWDAPLWLYVVSGGIFGLQCMHEMKKRGV